MKILQGEIGVAYGRDAAALYQSAMRRLVNKAYEEQAKFPLAVAVTTANGGAWGAAITLRGSEFDCKHFGTVSITFPLRMVAIDARNDRVASMDLMLPGKES